MMRIGLRLRNPEDRVFPIDLFHLDEFMEKVSLEVTGKRNGLAWEREYGSGMSVVIVIKFLGFNKFIKEKDEKLFESSAKFATEYDCEWIGMCDAKTGWYKTKILPDIKEEEW